MLRRSVGASFAKAVFFEHINDIDVYIEDTSDSTRKIASILFGRALGGSLKISRIFPLGNWMDVFDVCSRSQEDSGRLRLFVVDGDFTCWSCHDYRRLKRLYVLPRYCIENFLVDEHAIIDVLFEEEPAKDVDQLATEFGFSEWRANSELLLDLFSAYAIVRCMIPSVATVGRAVRGFVKNDKGLVDEVKIRRVVSEIVREVDQAFGPGAFEAARRDLGLQTRTADPVHAVSGKDYLLPLILIRMRSVANIKTTNASIAIRLARVCDVGELESMRSCIAA